MKNLFRMTLLVLALIPVAGCNGCRNEWKHMQSNIVGIKREIVLYNANGGVIKKWITTSKVEYKGCTLYFLDSSENVVSVSGTFICQEGGVE